MADEPERDGIVWCLICEQRPAEGPLRRIFADSHAPVISDPRAIVPQVCQVCADQVHGMPSFEASGRKTVWEFTLEDPSPWEHEDHPL